MTARTRAPRRIGRTISSRRGNVIPITANPNAVRWSRVADAQARIAAGWYERDDVQAQLVDAVFEELSDR